MTEEKHLAKIKLHGGPEQTVSSVFVTADGSVHFDFFDFSPAAQEHFGNDIAITIVVGPAAREALLAALSLPSGSEPETIISACGLRFLHYFDVQPFLEEHSVAFEKKFDTRA